jgi:RHS repeat-associated protein
MSSVTLPGSSGTVSFKYDPFGRRIYKSSSGGTSVYAYDGDNLVEETNSSGTAVARYSQGLNIDEPLAMLRSSTTSFYYADGLGSITSLSNSSGSIAQTYSFDSFGNQTGSSGSLTNSFRYTAREFDAETSLHYYRARYYDQVPGRFISEDPIGFHGGIHRYRYVLNSPTRYRDPDGLWPWSGISKAAQLDEQTQVDQRLYDMTSKFFTDPMLSLKCPRATPLGQINQLAYENLQIDAVLQGGMAIGLLAKYPEYFSKPQEQMLDMFGKLRDKNNCEIDYLNCYANSLPCRCTS